MRKHVKYALLIGLVFFLGGCWNYREVNDLGIVAGIAVDKTPDGGYEFTFELVDIQGGKQESPKSKVITMTGESMFDTARNAISISGDRLYWSHADIFIISQEVARDGIDKVIDWYVRDAETRPDVTILIAKTNKANEIFLAPEQGKKILSFDLSDIIKNEKSLAKSHRNELWEFVNDMGSIGITALAPCVGLKKVNDKQVPEVIGSAVFKKNRLLGFISGEDSKYALFVKDEIEGGLLVEMIKNQNKDMKVVLEIFKSKTNITPIIEGDQITMAINIKCTVAIGEVMGQIDVINGEGKEKLEMQAEASLRKNIERVIQFVQKEYNSDIFGFGNIIHRKEPQKWHELVKDWDRIFPDVNVVVSCDIVIKNSSILSQPLKVLH